MQIISSLAAALLLSFTSSSTATPIYSYPISLQYPPLIQYGQSYSYQVPADSFTSSDNTPVTYNATGLPDWLSFDSATRTFSGTAPSGPSSPQNNDIWFEFSASDNSGDLAVNSSLTVTNIDVTTLNDTYELTSALQQVSGRVANSNTVILTPNQQFYIPLSTAAFNLSSESPVIQYLALTSSHAPLPNWIYFDSGAFAFSGQAPAVNSDIAPSESFSFSLFAVQVTGTSSAALDIDIQVGAHQFSTNVTAFNKTVQPGDSFTYQIPLDEMSLDGNSVSSSNITNVTSNSDWLSYDNSATSIRGTVPENFYGENYTVTVTDVYSDSIEITLALLVNGTSDSSSSNGTLFTQSSISSPNATIGKYFTFTLPDSAVNSSSHANVSVSYDPPASWLSFNQDNLTFTGSVPDSFGDTKVTLSNNDSNEDKLTFDIKAVDGSTSTSPTPASSESSASPSTGSHSGVSKKTIAIICGTVIPVVVLLALLVLFLCCRRRSSKPRSISRPIVPGEEEDGLREVEKAEALAKPPPIIVRGEKSTEKLHQSYISSVYTPTSEHFSSSPSLATEINMYKLDNPKKGYFDFQASPISYFSEADSNNTHVDDRMNGVQRNIVQDMDNFHLDSTAAAGTAAVPTFGAVSTSEQQALNAKNFEVPQVPAQDEVSETTANQAPGQVRNSWRQSSQPEKRWHPREPGGSRATIGSDELPSMRLVGDESQQAQVSRDNSSPILRILGSSLSNHSSDYSASGHKSGHSSNSASIGSYSSSESEAGFHHGPAVPYSNASNLRSITESPHMGSVSTATVGRTADPHFTVDTSDEANDDFRTASSGDEFVDAESSDDDDEILHRRVNSRGEWEWSQMPGARPVMFGQAIDSPNRSSSIYSMDGDSRTITSVIRPSGEPVRNLNPHTVERRPSTKLVNFTKERSASINNNENEAGPSARAARGMSTHQSASAELAFI